MEDFETELAVLAETFSYVTINGSKCRGIKGISAPGRIVFKTKLLTTHMIDDSAGPNYVIRAVRRGPLLTKSSMHGPGWTWLPKAILLLLISGCPAATQRIAPYTASYYTSIYRRPAPQ